jgi:hypothetical protein
MICTSSAARPEAEEADADAVDDLAFAQEVPPPQRQKPALHPREHLDCGWIGATFPA